MVKHDGDNDDEYEKYYLDLNGNHDNVNDKDICIRPGETVELPCDASDADKFVRVWMKVQDKNL